MTSALFSPIKLAGLDLANRIVVAPMCQYSADDGVPSPWHTTHLGMLANSGAALVVVEATGVERIGRYLQVFHEDDTDGGARRWEHVAMGFGKEAAKGTPDPLFSSYFVLADGPSGSDVLDAVDTCNGATNASSTQFFATSEPGTKGTTGTRYFATDHSGMIRQHTDVIADITKGIPLQ